MRPEEPGNEVKAELLGLFAAGRYDEAAARSRRLTREFPEDGFGWKLLGSSLAANERFTAALPILLRAAELRPNDEVVQSNLGATLIRLGRPIKAIEHLRAAVAIKPDFWQAHANLGSALRSVGEISLAVESLRRSVNIAQARCRAIDRADFQKPVR